MISGDLDASAVSEIIAEAAVCADCIARKAGIARWRVTDGLERLRAIVAVVSKTARCQSCSKQTGVFRITASATPPPPTPTR